MGMLIEVRQLVLMGSETELQGVGEGTRRMWTYNNVLDTGSTTSVGMLQEERERVINVPVTKQKLEWSRCKTYVRM